MRSRPCSQQGSQHGERQRRHSHFTRSSHESLGELVLRKFRNHPCLLESYYLWFNHFIKERNNPPQSRPIPGEPRGKDGPQGQRACGFLHVSCLCRFHGRLFPLCAEQILWTVHFRVPDIKKIHDEISGQAMCRFRIIKEGIEHSGDGIWERQCCWPPASSFYLLMCLHERPHAHRNGGTCAVSVWGSSPTFWGESPHSSSTRRSQNSGEEEYLECEWAEAQPWSSRNPNLPCLLRLSQSSV